MRRETLISLFASWALYVNPVAAQLSNGSPDSKAIKEFAFDYMKGLSQQNLSDREIANQLASSMIYLEKMQMNCHDYYYINDSLARYKYQLYKGTWDMMFGPGKTSTLIMNEASNRRNAELNNAPSKKAWCGDVKQRGERIFGWGPIFEQ